MKYFTKLSCFIYIFTVLQANGQNYLIDFAGNGAAVSSVKVENLMKGTTLTLSGNDILNLTLITWVNSMDYGQSSAIKIYPNPMNDNSILQVYTPISGNAIIKVIDMTGKLLTQTESNLDKGLQEFHLSGLNSGAYIFNVTGSSYQYSGKLLSNSKEGGTICLEKISNNQADDSKTISIDSKGVRGTFDMEYSTGDRLKLTGISGNFSTVIMDVPTSNKTIAFNFMACTDGDNNNYPIVTIGTQVWMAENLKTTKYNDNTAIPLVTNIIEWGGTYYTPAYGWYNNDAVTNKATYGALYNGYAVNSITNGGKNICPTDWHVPSDAEWKVLTDYLGGETVAGGKLKESGSSHWYLPNYGATNEAGFSALPGGFRDSYWVSDTGIRASGYWWCSAVNYWGVSWNRIMSKSVGGINRWEYNKQNGLSVRCLRD
jgi:uncharacterized protein (TIGR02145 family)